MQGQSGIFGEVLGAEVAGIPGTDAAEAGLELAAGCIHLAETGQHLAIQIEGGGVFRIVGDGGAHADDNSVHQGPQPMQMHQSRRPVDIFGMSGFRRKPTVERLPDLADNHEIVHRALPQRTEHIRPYLRKRLLPSTENIAKVFPRIGRHRFARGEIAYWHAGTKNSRLLYLIMRL